MSTGATTGAAARVPFPLTLAWLDAVSIEFASQKRGRDVRYVLQAHHRPSGTKWSASHTFDDCRRFQTQLKDALRCGHSCTAQCPWLFTFVTSYFPRPSIFRSSSSDGVVNARREALTSYVETLRAALLKRENHTCTVLTVAAAEEFTQFVCGDSRDSLPLKQWAFAVQNQRAGSSSVELSMLENEDVLSARSRKPLSRERTRTETINADEDVDESNGEQPILVCGICDQDMSANVYTMKLNCGHEFHDECVVQHLNARMDCPTCNQPVHR